MDNMASSVLLTAYAVYTRGALKESEILLADRQRIQ